jgi:glycosyltransferase involved in cell wall biosynthesis
MRIIPNGVDVERFNRVQRDPTPRPPTVALIGRVVPIKDVKGFIRAAEILRRSVPDVKVLVVGPTEEDETYFGECKSLVASLGLESTVEFTGRMKLDDVLGKIDVNVLTSISEGQPLVILEAGAAGVPSVATDVGACRELIEGRPDEDPALGPGGEITPLANPRATAAALRRLLTEPEWYDRCARSIRTRCMRHYSQRQVDEAYGSLYEHLMRRPDLRPAVALRKTGS